MQELESMKIYFEQYSSGTKSNKVVIWVSSSFLISNLTQQRQELVNELKASGIRIYQLYTGNEIDDTMYDRLKTNLEAIGGEFFKVYDKESSKAAINSIIDMLSPAYPDYEVLFLFNPGQACYKTDADKIVGIIAGIDDSLNEFGPHIEIGLKEIYRNEVEGEVVDTPSDTEKTLVWRYKVESGTFTKDKNTFLTNLYKVRTVDGACDYDFFRNALYNNFYSVDNISANKKKVILVSDEVQNNKKIKKFIDDGIEVYYIYVGAPIDAMSKSAMQKCVADTGGKAFCVTNQNEFDDAISIILIRAFSVADNKDSDGDGISDCIELTGMILPDGTTVTTDAHNPDTDNDGLDDGYEMGVDRGTLKAVIDEKNGKILYYDNAPEASFFPTYNIRSHPRFDDYDNDGYSDYDEAIIYNSQGMESDVIEVQLSEYDKYISVDTSSYYFYDPLLKLENIPVENGGYGGNQKWFYDVNSIRGKNDRESKQLSSGCGVIAGVDNLLYIQKYKKSIEERITGVNTQNTLIDIDEYDGFIRYMKRHYLQLVDVEGTIEKIHDIATTIRYLLICIESILTKEKPENVSNSLLDILEMISDITEGTKLSDILTAETATWGIVPEELSDGLNSFLKDNSIDEFKYMIDYADDTSFSQVRGDTLRALRKDYPVILHMVGKTMMQEDFPGIGTTSTKLHNVNIVKLVWDKNIDKTMIYCSSWSKRYEIDLFECWTKPAYMDEVLGINLHKDIDELLKLVFGSQHAIVYPN